MSRISVESRTPQWQKGDLRLTRLKDPQTAQILIFKVYIVSLEHNGDIPQNSINGRN